MSLGSTMRTMLDDADRNTQLGEVVHVNPWVIDLLEVRGQLQDDEITLTQWVKRYHATDTIDEGDTVLLVRRRTGGQIVWLITDVLSDKVPT